MSRQVVTVALLAGLLAIAAPVAAQRQRNPGSGGGAVSRGSQAASGRSAATAPYRGGRSVSPGSAGRQVSRGYQQPRQYAASPQTRNPRYATGQPAVPGAGAGRYAVRRNPAYATAGPGYVNRGYSGRYVDPGYGRPAYAPQAYARRGYASPRSYAVPRGYVAPRGYAAHGYYGRPRYIAPGWHGGWGHGHVVVAPRYVTPFVIGYAPWYPYYYRPSIGLGIYYGAYGLYPFGTIPPAYYDPAPSAVYGGLRIIDAPRDAQVFADGSYVGIVDDFDGASQHLNLEPGQHRIEIHPAGATPIAFDVAIEAGRTVTLRAEMY